MNPHRKCCLKNRQFYALQTIIAMVEKTKNGRSKEKQTRIKFTILSKHFNKPTSVAITALLFLNRSCGGIRFAGRCTYEVLKVELDLTSRTRKTEKKSVQLCFFYSTPNKFTTQAHFGMGWERQNKIERERESRCSSIHRTSFLII